MAYLQSYTITDRVRECLSLQKTIKARCSSKDHSLQTYLHTIQCSNIPTLLFTFNSNAIPLAKCHKIFQKVGERNQKKERLAACKQQKWGFRRVAQHFKQKCIASNKSSSHKGFEAELLTNWCNKKDAININEVRNICNVGKDLCESNFALST